MKIGEDQKPNDLIFNGTEYTGISLRQFREYAESRIDAAIGILKDKKRSEKITELTILRASLTTNLQKAFQAAGLNDDALQNPKTEYDKKRAFDTKYKTGIKELQKIMALLIDSVEPGTNKKRDRKKVFQSLNRRAFEDISNKPRAGRRHILKSNDFGKQIVFEHIPMGWVTDEQIEILEKSKSPIKPPIDRIVTISSQIRDERQGALGNCLETKITFGVGDEKRVAFSGLRHTSPCVLEIEDDAVREHYTVNNVIQTMAIQFRRNVGIAKKQDGVFDVDMATMSLLSPLVANDPHQKQKRQVVDTRDAYRSLNGRIITVKIDNQPIKLRLQSNYMNVGTNVVRGIGSGGLQTTINHRGLNVFIGKFLKKSEQDFKTTANPDIRKIFLEIQDIEKEIEKDEKLKKEKNQLTPNENIIKTYSKIEILNKEIFENKNNPAILQKERSLEIVRKERAALKKQVLAYEARLDKIHSKIYKRRKALYKNKLEKIKRLLKEATKTTEEASSTLDSEDKQRAIMLQLYVDALDIYFNQRRGGYGFFQRNIAKPILISLSTFSKVPEGTPWFGGPGGFFKGAFWNGVKNVLRTPFWAVTNLINISTGRPIDKFLSNVDELNRANYQFQTRFLLLSQNMGAAVEWFCKSGEDRTGLLNEHIEAFCMFMEKNGRAPIWEQIDERREFNQFLKLSKEYGPHKWTAGDNAPGEEGLQVTDSDFKLEVSFAEEHKLATIGSTVGKVLYSPYDDYGEYIAGKMQEKAKAAPDLETSQKKVSVRKTLLFNGGKSTRGGQFIEPPAPPVSPPPPQNPKPRNRI